VDKSITHKLKTTKLTLASNMREDNFFWLYYAGMGDTGIHHIQDEDTLQSIKDELLCKDLLISDEIIKLPLYMDDSVKTIKLKKVKLNERSTQTD
jgi:hypothetical protein